MKYLTPEQILFLHARLISETGGSQGVRDLGFLVSAVGRPQAAFEGSDLYPDLFTKAAALMHSLIQNHPFVDGNKRTGIAAAALFLGGNGFRLIATNPKVEIFTLSVAMGKKDVPDIASWLENHSEVTEGEGSSS
jgi:death-on-curing protein